MLETTADVGILIIVLNYSVLLAILIAMTAGMAYAFIQFNRKMKEIMPGVQRRARQLADKTDDLSNKAAGPFIGREAAQARRKAERDHVISSLRRKKDGA